MIFRPLTMLMVSGLLAVIAVSVVADDELAQAENKADLRVATYNINYGNVNLRSMVATIRKTKADIVFLQETTRESEYFLVQELKNEYPNYEYRWYKGRYAAERFGVLSRYPISRLDFVPPKHGLFGVCVGEIRVGDQTVQIANVHLNPVMIPRGSNLLGILAAFNNIEKIHADEIELVHEKLKSDMPTIIAGDFNSLSSFRAPRYLIEKGFVDSFAEVTENPDSKESWHWPLRNGEVRLRIDYIFHNDRFETVDSAIHPSSASDHYLVCTGLKFSESENKQQPDTTTAE